MINPEIHITDSILEVKALGSIQDVSADLECVQTKTIAELIDAEEQQQEEENNTQN